MRWLTPAVVIALTSGCISEEEFKAVMKERDDARSRVTKLEDELDQAKGRIKELEKDLDKSREKVPTRPPEAQIAAAYSELRLTKGGRLRAVFDTNQGEITCELFPHIAPMTVLNFVGLAEGTKGWVDPTSGMKTTQPLYDGTKFHRVIKGFMIQGGDPLGTGRGGPGYMFGDEVWPDIRFDRAGVLAMANAGPGTNGSQFFITSSPQTHLNGKHTIFGKCDTETVERVMALPTGGESGSAPVDDVVVKTLKIERLPPAE